MIIKKCRCRNLLPLGAPAPLSLNSKNKIIDYARRFVGDKS